MSSNKFSFSIAPWKTLNERVEYTTNIFKLLKRDMILEEEKHTGSFFTIDPPDWINVIPLTPANEVVLVEQYRFGIEAPTLELPGGMVDEGEEVVQTAKRELLEETGYRSSEWEYIGAVSSNPAIQTNFTHTYIARNCRPAGEQNLGEHEFIKVHITPLETYLEMVAGGTIHHALVVAATGLFLLKEGFPKKKK